MKTLAPGRTETPHFGDTLLFMNKETDAKGSPNLPQAPEPPVPTPRPLPEDGMLPAVPGTRKPKSGPQSVPPAPSRPSPLPAAPAPPSGSWPRSLSRR